MKEKILGIMISLGHDKSVLSDTIMAVEPILASKFFNTDSNGNKLRSRVLINHAEGEMLASRTAKTILKSMTKQEESGGNSIQTVVNNLTDFNERLKVDKSEKSLIENALIHCSTVKDAIELLSFSRSKFYRLIKKYGIDTKLYLESTDDPDMLQDQIDDGLA